MTSVPRLVLDTNVVVSAFLWLGKPGQLIAKAGESEISLFTSRILLDELRSTLGRAKLQKAVEASGWLPIGIVQEYRKLVRIVRHTAIKESISRDSDDDQVLACAIAARADLIVTGDEDLLVLDSFCGIQIRTVAQALAEFT